MFQCHNATDAVTNSRAPTLIPAIAAEDRAKPGMMKRDIHINFTDIVD